MSAPQFTPGPWRVHTYNDGHLLGYIQGAPSDGERYGDAVVLKLAKPTSERSHANARLIAAAPELYEALANLLADFPLEASGSQAAGDALTALAKARGEA